MCSSVSWFLGLPLEKSFEAFINNTSPGYRLALFKIRMMPGAVVLKNRFSGIRITASTKSPSFIRLPSTKAFLMSRSRFDPVLPLPLLTAPVSSTTAILPPSSRESAMCCIQPQSALDAGGTP